MNDKIYLGRRSKSYDSLPKLSAYDMVVINLDDNNYVSSPRVAVNADTWRSLHLGNGQFEFVYNNGWTLAGDSVNLSTYGITLTYPTPSFVKAGDSVIVTQITTTDRTDESEVVTVNAELKRSGSCLEIENPWGTTAMADSLLAKIHGFAYQPYSAGGALIDPASEMGDGISAFGAYGGMFRRNLKFSSLMASDIAAPSSGNVEHELPYKSAETRKTERKFAAMNAELRVQSSRIDAKVAQVSPSGQTSFSWELLPDHFAVKSDQQTMLYIDRLGSQFAGKVRASEIEVGTIIVGGQQINAGYIQGGQIGHGTITGGGGGNIASGTIIGGNIASATVTTGNTTFGDDHASSIASINGTLQAVISGSLTISAIRAYNASFPNGLAVMGYDTHWEGKYLCRNI